MGTVEIQVGIQNTRFWGTMYPYATPKGWCINTITGEVLTNEDVRVTTSIPSHQIGLVRTKRKDPENSIFSVWLPFYGCRMRCNAFGLKVLFQKGVLYLYLMQTNDWFYGSNVSDFFAVWLPNDASLQDVTCYTEMIITNSYVLPAGPLDARLIMRRTAATHSYDKRIAEMTVSQKMIDMSKMSYWMTYWGIEELSLWRDHVALMKTHQQALGGHTMLTSFYKIETLLTVNNMSHTPAECVVIMTSPLFDQMYARGRLPLVSADEYLRNDKIHLPHDLSSQANFRLDTIYAVCCGLREMDDRLEPPIYIYTSHGPFVFWYDTIIGVKGNLLSLHGQVTVYLKAVKLDSVIEYTVFTEPQFITTRVHIDEHFGNTVRALIATFSGVNTVCFYTPELLGKTKDNHLVVWDPKISAFNEERYTEVNLTLLFEQELVDLVPASEWVKQTQLNTDKIIFSRTPQKLF